MVSAQGCDQGGQPVSVVDGAHGLQPTHLLDRDLPRRAARRIGDLGAEHFTRNAWVTSGVGSADNIDIRRRSEQAAAATTARDLADAVDAALTDLRATVAAQPPDRIVDLGDWGLKVDDFLLTRVMELVVHTDVTTATASRSAAGNVTTG